MAGGYTLSLPLEDKYYSSREEMREEIVSLLGGRAAEQLCLTDISTGASNDIERATTIARKMVTVYGMSEELGPIVYGSGSSEVFLGRDFAQPKAYSENVSAQIDREIKRIIDDCYKRAIAMLEENRDVLNKLAELLLEKEKVDGKTFEALFETPVEGETKEDAEGTEKAETVDTVDTVESEDSPDAAVIEAEAEKE
jgi:cell division protease FtsH